MLSLGFIWHETHTQFHGHNQQHPRSRVGLKGAVNCWWNNSPNVLFAVPLKVTSSLPGCSASLVTWWPTDRSTPQGALVFCAIFMTLDGGGQPSRFTPYTHHLCVFCLLHFDMNFWIFASWKRGLTKYLWQSKVDFILPHLQMIDLLTIFPF